jgi:hypothetical protein
MVFCSIKLAQEIFIVLFTIHKILQIISQNYCNFTMGVQASSMCYMRQPLYVKFLKWPKRRLLHSCLQHLKQVPFSTNNISFLPHVCDS